MTSLVVCVDFGSTYTKAALVDVDDGRLVARAEHGTTLDTDVLDGLNAALFDTAAGSPVVVDIDLPGYAYLASAIVGTLLFVALTIRRYQRISA